MVDVIAKRFVATMLAVLTSFAALATPDDAAIEARVTHIAQELRCLVCQNQTIADSTADLAIDLKNQVREQLAHGQSDQQVIDFMVQRYGDFVLYRPPVKRSTWLLWFGPLLLLIGGVGFLLLKIRKQAPSDASQADESADDLLFDDPRDHAEGRAA